MAHEVVGITPPDGEFARHAAFACAALGEFFQGGGKVVAAEGFGVFGQQFGQLGEVAAAGGEGVRRAAFAAQGFEVFRAAGGEFGGGHGGGRLGKRAAA